jgi:flagellar biosynthesis/type III secretory pathway protein FliH
MYYPVLAKGVRYFKEKGGRENMCDAVEKYARKQAAESRKQGIQQGMQQGMQQGRQQGIQQGIQQGRRLGLQTSIRNLMDSMKLTAEQAMDALKIPEIERSKYKL